VLSSSVASLSFRIRLGHFEGPVRCGTGSEVNRTLVISLSEGTAMEPQSFDRDITKFLLTAGFLPPFQSFLENALDRDLSRDLYGEWLASRPRNRIRAEMLRWLERGLANGSVLECRASPWGANEYNLLWWPRGRAVLRRVGLLSSRPNGGHARRSDWLHRLLACLESLAGTADSVCSIEGIVCDPWIKQWAILHGVALTVAQVGSDTDCRRWRRAILGKQVYAPRADWQFVFISPAQVIDPDECRTDIARSCEPRVPLADWWLAQLCDRIVVLYVRTGGKIDRMLELIRYQFDGVKKVLDVRCDFIQPDEALTCQDLPLWGEMAGDAHASRRSMRVESLLDSDLFFIHTTRGSSSDSEWAIRDALLRRTEVDLSAMGTLIRILRMGKVLGSSLAIRGGYRVVCLTSRKLRELMQMRAYRRHRLRWDFEPYGVAISRERLVAIGSRPVLYGEYQDWERLEERDRPFFQCRGTRRGTCDWTSEGEWRVLGDLELCFFSRDDLFAFVSCDIEAQALSERFHWRVLSMESERVFESV